MRYLHKHLLTFTLKFFCSKRGHSHKKKQAHISRPQHTRQHGSFCTYFLSTSTCLLKLMYLLLLLFWLGTERTWAKYSTLPVNYTPTCTATSRGENCTFYPQSALTPEDKTINASKQRSWNCQSNMKIIKQQAPVSCESDTGSCSPNTGRLFKSTFGKALEDMDKLIHLIHSYLNFYKHSLSVSVCVCTHMWGSSTIVCCCAFSPPSVQVFRLGDAPPTPIHTLLILKWSTSAELKEAFSFYGFFSSFLPGLCVCQMCPCPSPEPRPAKLIIPQPRL